VSNEATGLDRAVTKSMPENERANRFAAFRMSPPQTLG
jgi:hypothetical protein